jgi:hypothetical protein
MPKELCLPVQNATLMRWKIPSWVPPEARLPQKVGNPNTPTGVNTPRHSDSPEEWACWLWRYLREAAMHPGIHRGMDGISLASVRGMLLVTGHAPCGNGLVSMRNVFIMRATQLVATPGLYHHLVAGLKLSIAATTRVTAPVLSKNISIEDVAHLFMADGVTIPQVSDAHKWGTSVLRNLAGGIDASRRTEAMTALAEIQCRTSAEGQDHPRPLEPRWWYPPSTVEGWVVAQPPPQLLPAPVPVWTEMVHQWETLLAAVAPPPLPPVVRLPTSGSAPSLSSSAAQLQINDNMNAWTGMQVLYLCPKKKKKKKTAAEISEDEAAAYLTDEGQILPELHIEMQVRIDQMRLPSSEEEGMGPLDMMAKDDDKEMADDI